jgi:uncharacterized membrane protein YfcA
MVLAVVAIIVVFGTALLLSKRHRRHINKHWIQIVGIVFILPVILALAVLESIDNETLSVLLSLVLGYFFGITDRHKND